MILFISTVQSQLYAIKTEGRLSGGQDLGSQREMRSDLRVKGSFFSLKDNCFTMLC